MDARETRPFSLASPANPGNTATRLNSNSRNWAARVQPQKNTCFGYFEQEMALA